MTPELRAQAQQAVQVLTTEGRRLAAGRAVLFVLEELGWHPRLVRLAGRRPWIWAVEAGYWIVARHRPFFSRVLFRAE